MAYIGVGANLGDPVRQITEALDALRAAGPHIRVSAVSSLVLSTPLDRRGQPLPPAQGGMDYVNAVAAVDTHLTAPDLLTLLQELEHSAGRLRPFPDAPRTLDLDLLLYGDARMDGPRLTVPHPRMSARAFVLVPLAELAPARVSAESLAAVAHQGLRRL